MMVMCLMMMMILLRFVSGDMADLQALARFKNGLKGDNLGQLSESWNVNKVPESNGCPFNWYGVQCSGGRVVSITLNGLGLVGDLDFTDLISMEMLRNLSVSNNKLTGILPPEIGSMKALMHLDLSCNSFSGLIPKELPENLVNLTHLNLSSNNFQGIVPSGFGILKQLKYLDFRSNNFSGKIDFVSDLHLSVVHVDLSGNKFSGSLAQLSDNSSICTSIQYLNISNNDLSGNLFARELIPTFENLQVFDASRNKISGHVPSFQFVVSLSVLRLGTNLFSGSLPEALFKESSLLLSDLDLSNNQIEGSIKRITSTTLKKLNLSSNRLSGSLPSKVGSCSMVDFSNNLLSGNFSTVETWGYYIEFIDLSSNSLTGTTAAMDSSTFLRLSSLKVSNNSLAGELPFDLGTFPELSFIDLSSNNLHGSLPSSLFTSFRLAHLDLSRNSFTGQIPLSVSNKDATLLSSKTTSMLTLNSSLTYLDLSANFLTGPLPQDFNALSALKYLNISKNNISGRIPQQMSEIHGLEYLNMSGNHLEGIIPENLPANQITGFDVSYNDLSGIVPENLLRFPNSSFQPGNSLLIFPHGYLNPSLSITSTSIHARNTKPFIRNLIIIGIVGAICVMLILFVIIFAYYKLSTSDRRRSTKQKDANKQASPQTQTHSLEVQKNLDIPQNTSLSSPENCVVSSTSPPLQNEPENFMLATLESKGQLLANATKNPPMAVLRVCSPDKLAGDLHLFDNLFTFTAEELSRSPAEIIGRSCHGTSYKTTLYGDHVVTVKWLREGISKGKKDFAREAKKLGNIRHPNLVSLKGFYWGPRDHERFIISDYIISISLTSHLCETDPRKNEALSLSQRLSIAVDIANCLNFLHNERAIPHGNLKSSNILLQLPGLNPLLTDYSLHRIMNTTGMSDQVLNAGALGYRPPEFASTAKPCPSLKSDVYAFGVILLELLTGKNAGDIASNNPGIVDLTDWVGLLVNEQRSFECFDRRIPDVEFCTIDGPPKLLEDMMSIALRCIRSASERPEIRTVYEELALFKTSWNVTN